MLYLFPFLRRKAIQIVMTSNGDGNAGSIRCLEKASQKGHLSLYEVHINQHHCPLCNFRLSLTSWPICVSAILALIRNCRFLIADPIRTNKLNWRRNRLHSWSVHGTA